MTNSRIIALCVLGASGKMGKRIVELALHDPAFAPTLTNLECCDMIIDFSSPKATESHLQAAILANKPLVIGTTGHTPEERSLIETAAKTIPILFSPNFSFGMALCLETAARLGKALYGSCTIDIIETHHIHKKDRPSGTALALARAIGNGKTVLETPENLPRKKEEILIHSIRSQEVVGEHTLILECEHERIELKHTAHSRDAFAQGALIGAKFLIQQPPGLYSLKDLFLQI